MFKRILSADISDQQVRFLLECLGVAIVITLTAGCIILGYNALALGDNAMAQEVVSAEQYEKAVVEAQLATPANVQKKNLLKPIVFHDNTYPYVVQLIELRNFERNRYRICARFLHKRTGHEAGRVLSSIFNTGITPDVDSYFIQDAQLTSKSIAVSIYVRPRNPECSGFEQLWTEFDREPPFSSNERFESTFMPVEASGEYCR